MMNECFLPVPPTRSSSLFGFSNSAKEKKNANDSLKFRIGHNIEIISRIVPDGTDIFVE